MVAPVGTPWKASPEFPPGISSFRRSSTSTPLSTGLTATLSRPTGRDSEFRAIGEPWARTLSGGSTGAWESLAWQVFYPDLLYDKWTGEINREVAEHWRENYDLRHILERDWETLGPKLVGKLHIFMGDMDTYFLDEATRLLEEFLEGTTDPYYEGSFEWGERAPHCYSGAAEFPGQTSYQRVLPLMRDRILSTAPAGADVTSWRYE